MGKPKVKFLNSDCHRDVVVRYSISAAGKKFTAAKEHL